ncbi:MAG: hypothetical protein JEY71_11865 [Sphaerochaeta sp.]|nr:hypothetical protein [Sphaerochaeta sp.]
MTKAVSGNACLVGKSYKADGKVWRISTVLIRHDGIFLFLRREEGNRIIMREVLLDRTRIIEGEVNDTETRTQDISSETAMRKGTADGDMEARQCMPTTTEGTACSRDAGTRAGKGER